MDNAQPRILPGLQGKLVLRNWIFQPFQDCKANYTEADLYHKKLKLLLWKCVDKEGAPLIAKKLTVTWAVGKRKGFEYPWGLIKDEETQLDDGSQKHVCLLGHMSFYGKPGPVGGEFGSSLCTMDVVEAMWAMSIIIVVVMFRKEVFMETFSSQWITKKMMMILGLCAVCVFWIGCGCLYFLLTGKWGLDKLVAETPAPKEADDAAG